MLLVAVDATLTLMTIPPRDKGESSAIIHLGYLNLMQHSHLIGTLALNCRGSTNSEVCDVLSGSHQYGVITQSNLTFDEAKLCWLKFGNFTDRMINPVTVSSWTLLFSCISLLITPPRALFIEYDKKLGVLRDTFGSNLLSTSLIR